MNRSPRNAVSRNERGSNVDRLRRRDWLLDAFRADEDYDGEPAVRCYRCGALLIARLGPDGFPASYTLTIDRIVPGSRGGTYTRDNIRPACFDCNRKRGNR